MIIHACPSQNLHKVEVLGYKIHSEGVIIRSIIVHCLHSRIEGTTFD